MAEQLAFYINTSLCTGCRTCELACKDKNNLPLGIRYRRVWQYGGGSWVPQAENLFLPDNVYGYNASVSCMHCEEPACVKVCPTGAMTKGDNGIVFVNSDKCIGCRYCEWACPYGATHFNAQTKVMSKCDFCRDLIAVGEQPACVDSCPLRALDFGELEELRKKYGALAAVEPLPSAEFTHPSVVITPHKHAQMSGRGTGKIVNLFKEK